MNIFAKLSEGCATGSPMETRELAAALARALPPDQTLSLHGTLGVGKTTFTSGLAEGFGIQAKVTSPTFQFYNIYESPQRQLIHLDAYRLENSEQANELLLEEFLHSPWCLVVEWPEQIEEWLPEPCQHIYLSIMKDKRHFIRGIFDF
ncbi:MAG: tRNA (adenosine(37)-N6)-threonylcarbamoyltransferase complex ATPase subunit type 1 TsaE [Opitutales bacterium]|nr:tRNA (adenosine(37)-N6)-threonylcarbamoyltransferase complex ATPase subunit type 1 TsaE [Opitutales bacterium]MCH8539530.1 tRNA (adenosine(37)-N6)-threonylcarbamoyltransferase complex ATPase subunit type 1 TsaE [Opitutales bacterium]